MHCLNNNSTIILTYDNAHFCKIDYDKESEQFSEVYYIKHFFFK